MKRKKNKISGRRWWVSRQEALRIDPDFFNRRGDNSWRWDEKRGRLYSKWGAYEIRVMLKGDGSLDFDRAIYSETSGICAVIYGIDKKGKYHIGVIEEMRPFSDRPNGEKAEPPIVFGQPCVMGVLERIIGEKGAEIFEKKEDSARRESFEEAGVKDIVAIRMIGRHNPNPAICSSWDVLLEIEVDLEEMKRLRKQKGKACEEKIVQVEFIPVGGLLKRIAKGSHNGIIYRAAVPNNAFLVWLARHPEALR